MKIGLTLGKFAPLHRGHQFDIFFSSEAYGEHISKALNCQDVRIDQARKTVPISATMIRKDIKEYQHFLSALVFNDLMEPMSAINNNNKE